MIGTAIILNHGAGNFSVQQGQEMITGLTRIQARKLRNMTLIPLDQSLVEMWESFRDSNHYRTPNG